MFHQNGDDDIDEHELCHQNEDDEEKWRKIGGNAAVPQALIPFFTFFPQCVLHNSIPVITSGNAKQGQEGHSKRAEMGMLTKALARMFIIAFFKKIHCYMKIYSMFQKVSSSVWIKKKVIF